MQYCWHNAQIPLHRLSPKLPHGESRGHKPSQHVEMLAAKSWQVCDEVANFVANTNHESRRHIS